MTSLAAPCAPQAPTGLHQSVTFDAYSPFSTSMELIRRTLSPLNTARIRARLARDHAALHAQSIDLARERFALYVPPAPAPAGGDALLVFVPPWDDARVPVQWIPALNRNHTIFISAAHSGNHADVLNRREPLALLAAYGVMLRYHVNPARVYVGGFSGGSRVALRLALAYPDLFRGALLDAGSDPIGTGQIPLPSADLFHEFQQSSHIEFLTGDEDLIRQAQVARADASFRNWCVFDTGTTTMLHTRHSLADAAGFTRALTALMRSGAPDMARIAACRASHRHALAVELNQAQSLVAAGQITQATNLLDRIDAHYGGLAAPRSIELLRTIDAHDAPHP